MIFMSEDEFLLEAAPSLQCNAMPRRSARGWAPFHSPLPPLHPEPPNPLSGPYPRRPQLRHPLARHAIDKTRHPRNRVWLVPSLPPSLPRVLYSLSRKHFSTLRFPLQIIRIRFMVVSRTAPFLREVMHAVYILIMGSRGVACFPIDRLICH